MRLIDADALTKKEERYELDRHINGERCYEMAVPSWVIIEAPTIDAVQIVRCKECKHCDTGIDEDGNKFWKCLGIHYGGVNPDDFCSYGERKDNETD